MKAQDSSAWPLVIRRGSVSVKVYRTTTKTGYVRYQVGDYSGGKRTLRSFGDLAEAKRQANLIADKMASGQHAVAQMTSKDAAALGNAQEVLRPFDVSLLVAVTEYVAARKLLPDGVSIREVAADFARRAKQVIEQRTVPEVVDEFLKSKTASGRSETYLRVAEMRLRKFGHAHQIPVASLTRSLIQGYLDGLGTSARTRKNEFTIISTLIRYAIKRRYAPKDLLDDLDAVERPEPENKPAAILTPDELREVLGCIRYELVPWVVVGAFCGLRTAEILRLDWQDVKLDRGHIVVEGQKAKTRQRRIVPLCPAAVAWLTPFHRGQGRVARHARDNWYWSLIETDVNTARKAAGNKRKFKWERNVLRHSFCSYRMAQTHDAARVSLEAGNSPQMIFGHYREIVTEEEAKQWFDIMPTALANVVPVAKEVA